MNRTAIAWTEVTWNPNSGCEVVTEGCRYCYAKTLAERRRGTAAFPRGFELTIRPHKLREPYALKHPSLVFVNSMSDLFWDAIPDTYRDQVIDVIADTPQHQYQVLTKRPDHMLRYSRRRPLPPNLWAGVSIESDRLVARAETLRAVRAEVRFVSAEPLLSALPSLDLTGMDWLISGGESGTHLWDPRTRDRRGLVDLDRKGHWMARSDRIQWVRDLRDRCTAQGVAFFHKQWGGATSHSAGRILEGRTWDEFPRYLDQGTWIDRHPTTRSATMPA